MVISIKRVMPDVDFFDYETNPGPEELAALRAFDSVRTQAGSSETGSDEQFSGPDPAVNDVTRDVYAAVDLPEYQVTDTEGGEWLNYTRDFPEGEYHVYLRAAGRATQEIHLDEVTSDPSQFDQTTRRLGTFDLPNMGVKFNYRFVALKDDQKANVRLTLDGIKTLRLTIGDEREDRLNDTTALNYLLFTPAIEDQAPEPALTVLAASTLDGVYEPAGDAVVEADQIIIPVSSDMQFFKINVPYGAGRFVCASRHFRSGWSFDHSVYSIDKDCKLSYLRVGASFERAFGCSGVFYDIHLRCCHPALGCFIHEHCYKNWRQRKHAADVQSRSLPNMIPAWMPMERLMNSLLPWECCAPTRARLTV
jgi:hypothetical protein